MSDRTSSPKTTRISNGVRVICIAIAFVAVSACERSPAERLSAEPIRKEMHPCGCTVECTSEEKASPKALGKYHDVWLLGIAFVLTTLAGSAITFQMQRAVAERDLKARRADAAFQRASQTYEEAVRVSGNMLISASKWSHKLTETIGLFAYSWS